MDLSESWIQNDILIGCEFFCGIHMRTFTHSGHSITLTLENNLFSYSHWFHKFVRFYWHNFEHNVSNMILWMSHSFSENEIENMIRYRSKYWAKRDEKRSEENLFWIQIFENIIKNVYEVYAYQFVRKPFLFLGCLDFYKALSQPTTDNNTKYIEYGAKAPNVNFSYLDRTELCYFFGLVHKKNSVSARISVVFLFWFAPER